MNDWLILSFTPLIIIAVVAVLNAFTFPRLRPTPPPQTAPFASILIPMRNEAQRIGETVRSLLAQTYPQFEIILLDDQSEDGSAQAAAAAAQGDPRLKILSGAPLPRGWLGKNWACHQAAQHACGELLLFSDADVRWHPQALSALVEQAQRSNADLLTCWPTQQTVTWGERLTVPLMAFTILAYLPVLAVHYLPFRVFAAAMGQCLLFRRAAYEQIGGHQAVRGRVVEDMAFAYATKAADLRLRCQRLAANAHVWQLDRSPQWVCQKHPGRARQFGLVLALLGRLSLVAVRRSVAAGVEPGLLGGCPVRTARGADAHVDRRDQPPARSRCPASAALGRPDDPYRRPIDLGTLERAERLERAAHRHLTAAFKAQTRAGGCESLWQPASPIQKPLESRRGRVRRARRRSRCALRV